MTGFGKTFVFIQFMLSICLLGLGIGIYSNHIDWEGEIKATSKRISDLAAERDRAEARWNAATIRLAQAERERPFRKKLFDEKLALIEKGVVPMGAPAPAAFVTELNYVKSPDHALPYLTNDPGILNVLGGKPVQNRGVDVQYYTKIQEDLDRYNARRADFLGEIPKEQDLIAKLQAEYTALTKEINGDPGINLRGLRKERELQEIARANALKEQEFLKPMLANRYGETVLLLKRQNSLLARKAELEKVGVAAK